MHNDNIMKRRKDREGEINCMWLSWVQLASQLMIFIGIALASAVYTAIATVHYGVQAT